MIIIISHRPITAEIRYPIMPRAGKPKSKGFTPVVMIFEYTDGM